MAKVLRDASCDVGTSCPRIDKVDGGYDIVGTDIPDDTLPEHERKVRVPDTMLPELAVLDIPDFEAWLAERRRAPGDMLRIQTLESYAVASDDGDLAGYLNGAPVPTSKDREPFFQRLREEAAKGMVGRNLTLVNGHPSDYRRYGFEWVCPYSSEAGQQIRVLEWPSTPPPRCTAPVTSGWSKVSMSRWCATAPRVDTWARSRWRSPRRKATSPPPHWPGNSVPRSPSGGQRTPSTGVPIKSPD